MIGRVQVGSGLVEPPRFLSGVGGFAKRGFDPFYKSHRRKRGGRDEGFLAHANVQFVQIEVAFRESFGTYAILAFFIGCRDD